MKTEKSKSKRKKRQSSSESSLSSAESNSSSNNSSSNESIEKASKKYKQKVKQTSSNSNENSGDERCTSTKKIKYKKVKESKQLKSSKRNHSSENDLESSSCDEGDKKCKRSNKTQSDEDIYVKMDKEKTNENDTRLKRSRRELESSKWDSPVDKISYRTSLKSGKNNERSVSPLQKQRVEHNTVDKDKYSYDRPSSRNGEKNDNFNIKKNKEERKHQERRLSDRDYDRKGEKFREFSDTKRHAYEKYGKERHSGNEDRGRNRSQDDNRRRRVEDRRYRSEHSMKDERRSKSYERKNNREERLIADDRKRNIRKERSNSQDRNRNRNDRRDRSNEFKRSRFSKRESPAADYEWGKPGQGSNKLSDSKKNQEKEKPNFSLSGKLTEEVNTYKGIVIKYSEPPEAYKPKRRWRLYPFKGEKAMQTLYIHRETAYLLGRERKIVDIPLDHPSCSKQHSVLQYRLVPFERPDGTTGKRVRPYIIDLGSANGTFLNNIKIEPQKYIELFEKDVLKFGYSTREYVLLHENSKDEVQDDDVKEEEVKDSDKDTTKTSIKKEKLEPMEPILPQEVMIE